MTNFSELLIQKNIKISTAESCTGGLLAKTFTDVPGSSKFFDSGFVTYSNQSKTKLLQVSPELIKKHGAVSSIIAEEMAIGALNNSAANFSIAVTGIAGPSGGSKEKPVGTVYICMRDSNNKSYTFKLQLNGNRDYIRSETVNFILKELTKLIMTI
jgi:nicotinamide-nucleotide amidase